MLSDYIGVRKAKQTLKIYIEAAKSERIFGSCSFYGPRGLEDYIGRNWPNEMNVNLKHHTQGPIEKPGEIAAILNNLQEGDVFL